MTNDQKHAISMVLLCMITSVLSCILVIQLLYGPQLNTNTNTNTQTVNINLPEEERINLNTCTKTELMQLPGIGETLADRIIANRPYYNKWQIGELPGIGDETIKNIIDMIEV